MPKRFFWLKLKDGFFKQLAIKKLRKVAGGDTFVIIYLKMMLLSMNNEGKITFECNDNAEFAENLALELDEEEDNVKITLAFLESQKLIEYVTNEQAILPEVVDCIGCETDAAERKRRSRANKAKEQLENDHSVTMMQLECDSSVTMSQEDCENVTLEIRDKRIENIYNNNVVAETTTNTPKKKPSKQKIVRNKYGPHQNLFLSDTEIEQLKSLYPEDWERYIQEASEHLGPDESKLKAYAFVKNWGARDYQRLNRGKPHSGNQERTVEDELANLII